MRSLNGHIPIHRQELNDVPEGTCKVCGGYGRYRSIFKYRQPIISVCCTCGGAGSVVNRLRYSGETNQFFFKNADYTMIHESDEAYVVIDRLMGLAQVPKDLFTKVS